MIENDVRKLAIQNRVEGLRAALAAGNDPNERDSFGSTPLHAAIAYKSLNVIPVLLEHGADVAIQDENGHTALHYAIEHKLPNILALFLRTCPEAVSIANKHGNQPLWAAAFNARGNYEMVTMLLDCGADPTHVNKLSLTPLDIPKRKNEPALLELLESRAEKRNT